MDDIFLWTERELRGSSSFITIFKKQHKTGKFHMKKYQRAYHFLYTMVYIEEHTEIQTTNYRKSTDQNP